MISNFTAARRAIYSQRSASRSDTRAWRGADVGFPLPSCLPIGRMRCEPSAAGLGTSRWMCVLGAQRPLAAVAHVASEWPPDGRPRRRDGSFCGAGMPRAYVGRGWCSGRDRTVAYTSYNAHLRGCPRLPGARVRMHVHRVGARPVSPHGCRPPPWRGPLMDQECKTVRITRRLPAS